MASIKKFEDSAVANEVRHNNRTIQRDANTDINPERTKMNYSLTPYIHIDKAAYAEKEIREKVWKKEYQYYKKRKSEMYCYGRKDVKTLAGCIVTLPKEITDPVEQERFFKTAADFFSNRYGRENVVSITVHYDEGKTAYLKNADGQILKDKNGNPVKTFHLGQPHMHFVWIPACEIDHNKIGYKLRTGAVMQDEIKRTESGRYYIDRGYKRTKSGERIPAKNVPKEMKIAEEKISANDVLNKIELQHLHEDLQTYLSSNGIQGKVVTGITAQHGGNRTVKELKEDYNRVQGIIENVLRENADLRNQVTRYQQENKALQTKVNDLEKSTEKTASRGWGKTSGWGKDKSWEITE